MGRMINFFDLTGSVIWNSLLTDKPHNYAASPSRSLLNVGMMISSPSGDYIEDKLIISDTRKTSPSKKANRSSMKMLIGQEMLREVDPKHNSPNVVAKLMGLDALPRQQPDSSLQRSYTKDYSWSRYGPIGMPLKSCKQENEFVEKEMLLEVCCTEHNDFKDVHEICEQSQPSIYTRDKSPQGGRSSKDANAKKMALIREKFMEAKLLATDEKLRQSKEFQDALEVLSSNKDLLLKFLREPNFLFSEYLYELQSAPSPETKRITVLRPSKMVDKERFSGSGKMINKPMKRQSNEIQVPVWKTSLVNLKVDEYPAHPTQIVMLKPCHGKTDGMEAVTSPTSSTPRILQSEKAYKECEDDGIVDTREMAREITQHVQKNLMGHCREEYLYSSTFSNGYTGDGSFDRSENDYAAGNLSDFEVMSPSPRHSWDYVNRYDSRLSSSSFSRPSFSPESSVCREAKKRLSERWAMMASNGNSQELRKAGRSSQTLGEMLALSDLKSSLKYQDESNEDNLEPRGSFSCSMSNLNEAASIDGSKNLSRSKSVPLYETRFDGKDCDVEAGKILVPAELKKSKSTKLSLKGKVTSLFFARNKRSSKENFSLSPFSDESQSETTLVPITSAICGSLNKTPSAVNSKRQNQGITSLESGLLGIARENQSHPSPISVLDTQFKEDNIAALDSFACSRACGCAMPMLHKSNLLNKSPPIESITRTLPWDNPWADLASSYTLESSMVSRETKEEEQDWLSYVQRLLSSAGIDGQQQSDTYSSKWHSFESPLDPSLRDKYADANEKEPLHEAKRRQQRSIQKLVFDCVNAALVSSTGYEREIYPMSRICYGSRKEMFEDSPILVDLIMAQMTEILYSEMSNSLVVDSFVRKEVVGKGWVELVRSEMDNLGKEIQGKLLEELVEEVVYDLRG